MSPAPPADRFPDYPASWYLFGPSRELARRPVSKTLLGRPLVAFRGTNGRVAVLDGRCAHLGADLGRGRVEGGHIQCPLHAWEYDADGDCRRIPAQARIPEFARLMSYPVTERHGLVFFFNGREALFPLPFFFDRRPEDFVAGRPFRFMAACSWYMLAANGFDSQHFEMVHDRRLVGPPAVDLPAPYARRIRFHCEVTGRSIFDRLLRRFVGKTVEVTITNWGGPLTLVTGSFRRVESLILIATQPSAEQSTLAEVFVFAPRGRRSPTRALLQPIGLAIRRLFTQGFMRDDIDRLGGIRYNPESLLPSDRHMIEFFQWAAAGGKERTACTTGP
jgi:nitrite reductase/ring-hydroxylating ferredoxin subunit